MSVYSDRTESTKLSSCPCCGQPIDGLGPVEAAYRISGHFGRIVEAIARFGRSGRPVNAFEVAEVVYADDPDGGPDDPTNGIRVLIWKRRPQFRAYGWDLEHASGRGGGYRIVRYAEEANQ